MSDKALVSRRESDRENRELFLVLHLSIWYIHMGMVLGA